MLLKAINNEDQHVFVLYLRDFQYFTRLPLLLFRKMCSFQWVKIFLHNYQRKLKSSQEIQTNAILCLDPLYYVGAVVDRKIKKRTEIDWCA